MTAVDDAITGEIVRNGLAVAAEEASIVVVRAGHSSHIQEGADACAALVDAGGQLVTLSTATSLMHAASLRCSLPSLVEDFPLATMRPGDVFALNDPYRGGIHANDILVFRPVFADGGVVFFAGTLIHVADVGGISAAGLASLATDTFVEGLLLPPVRLLREGEPVDDVMRIIGRNSRTPDKVVGDVQALVAGVNVIARRVDELHDRFGAAEVAAVVDRDLRDSERRMRASLAELPPGRYESSFTIDSDGVGGAHVRSVRRSHAGRRRNGRRRLGGDVGAGAWRDQRVGLADVVRHRVRDPLLRRPDHPDERGVLPAVAGAPAAGVAGEPRPARRVRRAARDRRGRHRGDPAGARAGRARTCGRRQRADPRVRARAARTPTAPRGSPSSTSSVGSARRDGADGPDATGAFFLGGRSVIPQVEPLEAQYPFRRARRRGSSPTPAGRVPGAAASGSRR